MAFPEGSDDLDRAWKRACFESVHSFHTTSGALALKGELKLKSPVGEFVEIKVSVRLLRLDQDDLVALRLLYDHKSHDIALEYPNTQKRLVDLAPSVERFLSDIGHRACFITVNRTGSPSQTTLPQRAGVSSLYGLTTDLFDSVGGYEKYYLELITKRLIDATIVKAIDHFTSSWHPEWWSNKVCPLHSAKNLASLLHISPIGFTPLVSDLTGPDNVESSQRHKDVTTRKKGAVSQATKSLAGAPRGKHISEFYDHELLKSVQGVGSLQELGQAVIKRHSNARHARYLERSSEVASRSPGEMDSWTLSDHLDMGGLSWGACNLPQAIDAFRGTSTILLSKQTEDINDRYWFVVGTRRKLGDRVSEVALTNGVTTRVVAFQALIEEAKANRLGSAVIRCRSREVTTPIYLVPIKTFVGNGKVLTDAEVIRRGLKNSEIIPAAAALSNADAMTMHRIKWLSYRFDFYRSYGLDTDTSPFLMTERGVPDAKLGLILHGMPYVPTALRGRSLGVDLLRAGLADDSYRRLCPTHYSIPGYRNRLKLHRAEVAEAQTRGCEIPMEVMVDYPDLFPHVPRPAHATADIPLADVDRLPTSDSKEAFDADQLDLRTSRGTLKPSVAANSDDLPPGLIECLR